MGKLRRGGYIKGHAPKRVIELIEELESEGLL